MTRCIAQHQRLDGTCGAAAPVRTRSRCGHPLVACAPDHDGAAICEHAAGAGGGGCGRTQAFGPRPDRPQGHGVLPARPATPNTPASSTRIQRAGRSRTPDGPQGRECQWRQRGRIEVLRERERRDRDEKVTPEQKIERLRKSRGEVARAEPRRGPRQPVTTLHVTGKPSPLHPVIVLPLP